MITTFLASFLNKANENDKLPYMLMPYLESAKSIKVEEYNNFAELPPSDKIAEIKDHLIKESENGWRDARVVFKRQVAQYLAYVNTHESHTTIGEQLGGKDRTTVIHSISKVRSWMKLYLDYRTEIERIADEIGCDC